MATTASTRGMGRPSARPTSRIAARAASVPNVPIWATFSMPYFSLTYWITSPRRCWQKSMSISGASRRLSSRNRSKSRSYSSGQTWLRYKRVGHQRADARAAGRGRNALRPGEAHEVPHDEEVVGEAQLVDHVQLALQPGHHLFGQAGRRRIRSGLPA